MNRYCYGIILIVFIIFSSCQSNTETSESIESFSAPVKLSLLNEWQINSPDIIPNPRYFGVFKDTTLIIVDHSLNTINHFDKNGSFINTFGGSGRGPGEFSAITHATINADGLVAVADINNARFSIIDVINDTLFIKQMDPGWHTRLHWVSDQLIITNNPFKEGANHPGDIFMRIFDPKTDKKNHLFHLELEWDKNISEDQISCTFCEHRFMDDLRFFTSPQDTSYRIYRVNPNTDETVLFTRSGIPAVKYTEQERRELQSQRHRAQQITGLDSGEDDIPTHKRRFIDFFPDQQDRLWALVNPFEDQPPTFDLFSPDSDYIGYVQVPEGIESAQFIPDNYILFRYESDNPDVWKGGLYKILDE